MSSEVQRQVERIHASPVMAVLAVSGGGAKALTWLLATPGASRTVLEAVVPYSTASLADFLGHEPEGVATSDVAVGMARCAYERAKLLRRPGVQVVGIGCTAALVTDRHKKGVHRCFAAAWTEHGAVTYGLVFRKGLRDREGEDDVVSTVVLRALAEASGLELNVPVELAEGESVEVARAIHGDALERLLRGDVDTVTVETDGVMVADAPVEGGVLPGSLDPLHEGHEGLARAAQRTLGAPVTFELSTANVDKPPLDLSEVRHRVARLRGRHTVVVTRATRFHEKARLFPGCTFVIGWDTLVRLVEPRYYDGDESAMRSALGVIESLGCRFLVAGRVDGGLFRTLADVPIPEGFRRMFASLPESAFRRDLSSTELRAAGRRQMT